MPLKSDPSEEAIWGPQHILITLAILLCYYHNYPFAPNVLIRNSPCAPRGWKERGLGECWNWVRVFYNCSLMLFERDAWEEDATCFWNIKTFHFTFFDFLWYLCHLKYSHIPASFLLFLYLYIVPTRLQPLHPSVLYLAFCLTISCCLLYSFPPLPPPLKSTLYCYLSSSILISSPQMHPPIFPFCCLSLLPRLQEWRTFSISAQLLQINDLICRNKQVSSTLG